jgi:hypothetical protein
LFSTGYLWIFFNLIDAGAKSGTAKLLVGESRRLLAFASESGFFDY